MGESKKVLMAKVICSCFSTLSGSRLWVNVWKMTDSTIRISMFQYPKRVEVMGEFHSLPADKFGDAKFQYPKRVEVMGEFILFIEPILHPPLFQYPKRVEVMGEYR